MAAAMLASFSVGTFAEQNAPIGTKTVETEDGQTIVVVDTGSTGETTDKKTDDAASSTEASDKTVSSEETTDDVEEQKDKTSSGSGLDVSNIQYSETDTTGWTKWDGKTKMVSGTNYYIDEKTAPRKNFSVPKGSKLLIKSGAQLVIYKSRTMNVRGIVIVEPDASLTVSGIISIYKGAGLENYGTAKGSVSSQYRIAGDFINRGSGKMTLSGITNVYKNGTLLNYGEICLTSNSTTKVTGDFQTGDTGRLICSGYFAVTINGRTSQAGYFSLTGEVVNSGVFIFESTVHYYKSKSARFAVSKSSRLIDYRYRSEGTGSEEGGHNDESEEEATDVGIKGIDVSYAQGTIDWQAVKESGVKFAILRASRGSITNSSKGSQDTTFEYNVTEATKAGIDVGVYHYLYAETVADAKKEAKFFIKTISPYKITYPVVLDVEEQSQANLGKSKITKIVKAFLDEVSNAGYYAMIYSNKTWLTTYLDMSQLSDYDVWLAQWNTVPTYSGEFGIWQYSCKGLVSGIEGYVDMNLSYKNYAKIIRKGGYNNLS